MRQNRTLDRLSAFSILILVLMGGVGQIYCSQSANEQRTSTDDQKKEIANIKPEKAKNGSIKILSKQLILVLTEDWDEFQGKLYTFERKQGEWEQYGEPIPIVVGKNGMGWGKGLEIDQILPELPGPHKKEGDLKSPAGIFEMGNAFGYAEKSEIDNIKLPYIHVDAYTQCIEDINSQYYNKIVSEQAVVKDWNSTDHMLRKDDLYQWGAEIAHNYENPKAGDGSCIFLHVWRNASSGTAGCTAMEKKQMRDLLAWLDPQMNPLLIQLPLAYFPPVKLAYQLPEISGP